ncbi:NADPH-dependent FMN reductase [Blastococcus xanthinilyticus]|uniref:NAD(P)H-dependent FMN reductase n=1 Tax=Blastococcus xanthinilyticus TaxID=1564164 RepID=A0A5S5CUL4_9ACTN|nr:NAD(P)H-dependent oxidoreductase [Blastococcus xanthinilyticus]TYP87501.1 NAD(P)H-dependent FMN reductase [Blastococcus xanthinilyticus]
MPRIAIIVGSTRPGRRAESVARWVHRVASGGDRAHVEVVDLAEYGLPILDEPAPAAMGTYAHEHTRRWADAIASYDGYVFVAPEYNHSLPAALKNAIDYLYSEWGDKAAGLVTYGLQGGVRAGEHLRLVLAELKIADVRTHVALSLRDDFRFDDPRQPDTLTPPRHQEVLLLRLLDEVADWSEALAQLRRGAAGAARKLEARA